MPTLEAVFPTTPPTTAPTGPDDINPRDVPVFIIIPKVTKKALK